MKSALEQFVSDENQWRALFGHTLIDLDLSSGRQELADLLDSKLSPENLSCDGELGRSAIDRRYRYYSAVAQQLKQLDPFVEFYEYE
jgi:hypothetical protein